MNILEIIGAITLGIILALAALWTLGVIEFGTIERDDDDDDDDQDGGTPRQAEPKAA